MGNASLFASFIQIPGYLNTPKCVCCSFGPVLTPWLASFSEHNGVCNSDIHTLLKLLFCSFIFGFSYMCGIYQICFIEHPKLCAEEEVQNFEVQPSAWPCFNEHLIVTAHFSFLCIEKKIDLQMFLTEWLSIYKCLQVSLLYIARLAC